jgi:hypothetical protein
MSILDTIVAQKRLEVGLLPPGPVAAFQLREAIQRRGSGVRDFTAAPVSYTHLTLPTN